MKFKSINLTRLKPDILFLIFACFFGLIFLVITPPFQSPDEINHFYRAYQISEGQLISIKKNDRVGGEMPVSLLKITEPFLGMRWNMHAKTSFKTIVEQFKIPLEPEKKIFVDFPNTGMYSPVSYLPQSIPIFFLRKLGLSPLSIFYGARIFTLFFWIFCVFYSIRIIPFYKWFFMLIALLPMSLFINMSLSADVVTNLLSFILIAYVLKLAYSEQNITVKNFIVLAVVVLLLASAKLVYTPLILLFLIIPKYKFQNKQIHYVQFVGLLLISVGTVLFWSKLMNSLYLPYNLYDEKFRDSATLVKCADMHAQVEYILKHGLYLWRVFSNSMVHTFDMYFQGYIGTFGWLDTKLPVWVIYVSYSVLISIACADTKNHIAITRYQKIVLFISIIVIVSLILLTQHLTWDCVGGDIIATIQGRYFIPVFPLLFMLFYNTKFKSNKIIVPLVVVVFSFLSLSFSARTLYARYYLTPTFDSVSIKCDAENITKDNGFETNLPSVFLENATTRCIEAARSGMYSVKLTPKNQFGYTYRLHNCRLGDIINVEVWRYGKEGGIVISGGTNNFFVGKSEPIEKDSAGWEHLQLDFTIPQNMKNKDIEIYIYYSGKELSYFDDFAICYKKLQ